MLIIKASSLYRDKEKRLNHYVSENGYPGRLHLKFDGTGRNQISSFGESDKSV